MERVSVYIDGANFLYGLKSINKMYTDTKFDFEKFIAHIINKRELVQVYYYNAPLKQQYNKKIYWKQNSLFNRLIKNNKFKVVLCKRQRRIKIDGTETFNIKGDDIHLAIDMLKDAYEEKYDTAIIISGDGDFAPLVKYVKNRRKKVENYHFAGNISLDLIKECSINTPITKKTVNKFFYREPLKLEDTESGKKLKGLLKSKIPP